MRKVSIGAIGFCLLGVLAIAAFFIALGSREYESFPSATSYKPSGTSALYEVLKRSGVATRIDTSATPAASASDVIVAFVNYPTYESFVDEEAERDSEPEEPRLRKSLKSHLKLGGTVVVLPLHYSFQTRSDAVIRSKRNLALGKRQLSATWDSEVAVLDDRLGTPRGTIEEWTTHDNDVFARVSRVEKGTLVVAADGIVATNRFIDLEQNAELVHDIITRRMKPSSTVVFAEAAFGNLREKSLAATIGPWAQAAWWQLVFLFGLMVYALGKPFGLPEVNRRVQFGTRELVEAVAGSYRRGRMTKTALESTLAEADLMLRKWYRGVFEHLGTDPESLALTKLRHSVAMAKAAMESKPNERQSLDLVAALEAAIHELAEAGGHRYGAGE